MAATGEPYSVAARALDAAEAAEASAAGQAEVVGAKLAASEHITAEPAAAAPTADPGGPLSDVIGCADRTLAAASARLEIRTDTDLGRDPVPARRRPLRRRPGLLGRLTRRAGTAALGRVAPGMTPAEVGDLFLHQFGAGFIEPAAGRYQVDFGGYAEMLVDGRRYGGLSGEPLGPRYEQRPHRFRRDDPLDALRKLQRATSARLAGTERVRRTTCRVVATTVDDEEFTVWLDDQRVQRFRTVQRGSGRSARTTRTETVELWDYGVPVDELDWSRLPTFRTAGGGDASASPPEPPEPSSP